MSRIGLEKCVCGMVFICDLDQVTRVPTKEGMQAVCQACLIRTNEYRKARGIPEIPTDTAVVYPDAS